MNSFASLTGSLFGFTTSTIGDDPRTEIGVMSLMESNGSCLYTLGLIT